VGCELRSYGRSKVRNYIDVAIIAECVCLDVSNGLFYEIGRQRAFAEEQFVRAISVFDARPDGIARVKA
jgi:hypothetical protein